MEHNITELNKRGVEEIVISCPGCWVTLNHYYREWAEKLGLEYKVRIKHITEVTADLLREGKLKFRQAPRDGGRLTYHDPCHIGRHAGIYEPPREILRAIPGVEFVEMEHHRENGLCCGSVLSRVGRPPAADAIGALRITEAENAGAGIVLTAPLKAGDKLHIKGHTTDQVVIVQSMQINNVDVKEGKPGDEVGIKIADKARGGDIVYKVTE